jgi:large subunit ribosomal protein L16
MASRVYRKQRKGRNTGAESRGCSLAFGTFGLRAVDYCLLTTRQLDAAKVSAMRPIKNLCTMWKRVFPDIPVTRKPKDVRMGGGKGSYEFDIFRVKPGRILLEVTGVSEQAARDALALASSMLPVKTRFVKKEGRLFLNA